MSLTILSNNYKLNAINNPIYFVVDSTNKTAKDNFRYVLQLSGYTSSLTADTLTSFSPLKHFPDPTNSDYGMFDLSSLLSSELKNGVPFTSTTKSIINNTNIGYPFLFDLYEEYNYESVAAGIAEWAFPGELNNYTTLLYTLAGATTPLFEDGQQIYIEQNPIIHSELNGIFTVLSAVGTDYVVIDLPWDDDWTSPTLITATTKDAYSRRTKINSTKVSSGLFYCFDGKYTHQLFKDLTVSGISQFNYYLSDIPSVYYVHPTNEIYLAYFSELTGYANQIKVDVVSGGTTYSLTSNTANDYTNQYKWILAGGSQLDNQTLINSNNDVVTLNWDNITQYSISLLDSNNNVKVNPITFKIINYCNNRSQNLELIFQDKKGSYIPFNFEAAKKEYITDIKKYTFENNYGKYNSSKSKWDYNSFDKITTAYNSTYKKSYTAFSNWIDENIASYLEQMFYSKNVYIKINNEWIPIIITNTDYEKKKRSTGELINIQIDFVLSINN